MAEGYISKVVCACGCDTYLSQPAVDRGWKYLWGHKPKHVPLAARPERSGCRAKRVLSAVSYGSAAAMVLADIQGARRLMADVFAAESAAMEALRPLLAKSVAVEQRVRVLCAAALALTAVTGEGEDAARSEIDQVDVMVRSWRASHVRMRDVLSGEQRA
jgi:hypothetical protein